MIYLDNAATTFQKPPEVYKAVADAMKTCASQGRGGYASALHAAETVYACRENAAALFSIAEPEKIAFTYNATMALNMAIKGIIGGEEDIHAVVSGYEHNAVMRPLAALRGVTTDVAAAPLFQPEAMVEAFRKKIRPDTRLAVCTHVSNVFGYILPVEEIDFICAEHGIPLIIDASQSAGCVNLDASALRAAAFICMPGHKGLYSQYIYPKICCYFN